MTSVNHRQDNTAATWHVSKSKYWAPSGEARAISVSSPATRRPARGARGRDPAARKPATTRSAGTA
ncbi:hypothetical protein ACIBIZ_33140 [Nonomuraea spiralis]|uniref:hypothetical protein n=1 Tax=Nonomuraea spiralis TaxID=46182 RepID=UPI0037BDDD0B